MSRKFKSLLNLTTLATDPVGSVGDVFFNTTEKALKIHNGTTWIILTQNTDPAPFYMHTHNYDGEVDTIFPIPLNLADSNDGTLQADGGNVTVPQTDPPGPATTIDLNGGTV